LDDDQLDQTVRGRERVDAIERPNQLVSGV
jgi:hypothetical protein